MTEPAASGSSWPKRGTELQRLTLYGCRTGQVRGLITSRGARPSEAIPISIDILNRKTLGVGFRGGVALALLAVAATSDDV